MEATGAHGRGLPCGKTCGGCAARLRDPIQDTRHWPLSQWRARSAVAPPRSIPNRVVKRGSVEGTGGWTAGRLDPCAILARRGAVAARRAHNPKVDGSNPSAATIGNPIEQKHCFCSIGFLFYCIRLITRVVQSTSATKCTFSTELGITRRIAHKKPVLRQHC